MIYSIEISKVKKLEDETFNVEFRPSDSQLRARCLHAGDFASIEDAEAAKFLASVAINEALNEKSLSLDEIKDIKLMIEKEQMKKFIYQSYDPETQASLNAFMTGSIGTGNTARFTYISTALEWISICLTEYYKFSSLVEGAKDRAAVDKLLINYKTLKDKDPKVSLRTVIEI